RIRGDSYSARARNQAPSATLPEISKSVDSQNVETTRQNQTFDSAGLLRRRQKRNSLGRRSLGWQLNHRTASGGNLFLGRLAEPVCGNGQLHRQLAVAQHFDFVKSSLGKVMLSQQFQCHFGAVSEDLAQL